MNRTEKADFAVKLRAKLAELTAAPSECFEAGKEEVARGGMTSPYAFAFGGLEARVKFLAADIERLIVSRLDRGRGRK